MDASKIETTTIDDKEFYLVPSDEYELAEADNEETEEENDGVQLSSVLLGAGLTAVVVGLISLIRKVITAIKKRKSKKSAESKDSAKVQVIDPETDEVIAEIDDED